MNKMLAAHAINSTSEKRFSERKPHALKLQQGVSTKAMAHVLHMFPRPGRKSASIACLLEAFVTLQGLLTETHQLKATEKRDPL